MLSGESTPLLKESIQLLDGKEHLDPDSTHKNVVLFSGTKVLQSGSGGSTPDDGCLGIVLRTGFGTAQGELVRTMIFSTERVSANNLESFFFIGFLLIFAIAASWYVWVKGKQIINGVITVLVIVPARPRTELEEIQVASRLCFNYYECRSS
jgi:manganese-transporting P-type ATPase